MRSKWKGCLTAALLLLMPALVTACGGGTTAPAPPPAGPNSSLANLASNETFPMISAVMAADLDINGLTSNVTSNVSTMSSASTIEYDAIANAFRLVINNAPASFAQTFGQADVVVANSDTSYRDYQVTRSDSTIDEFVLFIPAESTQNLSYVTYGVWNSQHGSSQDIALGTIVFGVQTVDSTMPTTGSATYTGLTNGTLNLGNNLFNVGGDMSMTVNFGTGAVNGSFTNMAREDLVTGDISAWRNFTTAGTISAGSNLFSGTAASTDSALSGTFNGAFFGPVSSGSPPEIGGAWRLSGPGGELAVGGYVGKR